MGSILNQVLKKKDSTCEMLVAFTDIVSFTRRFPDAQHRIATVFNNFVEKALLATSREYVEELNEEGVVLPDNVVKIPTGDGAAVAFPFARLHAIPLVFLRELLHLLAEHNAANNCPAFAADGWCPCHDSFHIRCGISRGWVTLSQDKSGKINLIGDAINMAARVMDIAPAGRIYLTRDAWSAIHNFTPLLRDKFTHLPQQEIKHGLTTDIYLFEGSATPVAGAGAVRAPQPPPPAKPTKALRHGSARNVLLIATGGTIAGKVASTKQEASFKRNPDQFLEILTPSIDYMNSTWSIDISISTHVLCNIDSSDMCLSHWKDLISIIKHRYDEYDAFVIVHGTNTMGYTCAALSFALANPNKPIVFTGSQVPAGLPGADGLTNLENALRVALWERDEGRIKGVVAVFGSHIIAGTRVKKTTEFDYDAFASFSSGSIGRIGRIININEANLNRHLSYLRSDEYPPARRAAQLVCHDEFDMRIASLTEFPGMSSDIFRALADSGEVKGIILRAFGAGDVSTRHHEALEYLKEQQIPVVVTTQVPNGNSNFQVNYPGEMLRQRKLAIPAYDMSIEAQTAKLGWLLGKKRLGNLTYTQIVDAMVRNVRGEVNVMWEG